MNNIEATKEALKKVAGAERLWLLKEATKSLSTPQLGGFCRDVGATVSELAALIRDRAAIRGMRPEGEKIK